METGEWGRAVAARVLSGVFPIWSALTPQEWVKAIKQWLCLGKADPPFQHWTCTHALGWLRWEEKSCWPPGEAGGLWAVAPKVPGKTHKMSILISAANTLTSFQCESLAEIDTARHSSRVSVTFNNDLVEQWLFNNPIKGKTIPRACVLGHRRGERLSEKNSKNSLRKN